TLWFFWPMLPWGLGLYLHWVGALVFTENRKDIIKNKIIQAESGVDAEGSEAGIPDTLIERRVASRIKFLKHLYTFLGVAGFFLIINLVTTPRHIWFFWPVLPWALGLFIHWRRVTDFRRTRQKL
ncbi:MAG: 2TM domain-containing protein, partial [Deltaproteobacteria bacterium]|nr:2TM domain-containing protein [Deltaproteobacteria bacterium]